MKQSTSLSSRWVRSTIFCQLSISNSTLSSNFFSNDSWLIRIKMWTRISTCITSLYNISILTSVITVSKTKVTLHKWKEIEINFSACESFWWNQQTFSWRKSDQEVSYTFKLNCRKFLPCKSVKHVRMHCLNRGIRWSTFSHSING